MAARTVGGRSNIADILTHEELVQDVLPVATGTVEVNKEHVESFLECAICRGVMQEPVMIKQCLHRFCKNCLEHSLRTLKNECPLCRTRVPSRRSLERDTRFAKLIELVYKDVGEYEAQQSSKLMAAAAASRANAAAILQAARTTRQGRHDQDSAVIREQTARLQRDAAALADVAAAAAATPTAPAVSAGKRPREAPAQAPKATAQPKRARRDEGQADVPPVIFKLGRVPEAGLLGPCFSSGIGGSQGKFHQMPAVTPFSKVAAGLPHWFPQFASEVQAMASGGWRVGLCVLLRSGAATPPAAGGPIPSKEFSGREYHILHPLPPGTPELTLGDLAVHARRLGSKAGSEPPQLAEGGAINTASTPVLRLLWCFTRTHAGSSEGELVEARRSMHQLLLHQKHSSEPCSCGQAVPAFLPQAQSEAVAPAPAASSGGEGGQEA